MRKSTIWILAAIMAVAFFGLLYLQIEYIQKSRQMRTDHFDEAVKRGLYQVIKNLEIDQTKMYLEQEIDAKTKRAYGQRSPERRSIIRQYSQKVIAPDQFVFSIDRYEETTTSEDNSSGSLFVSPNKRGGNSITRASSDIQDEMIRRYLYERNNIDQIVTKLLEAPSKKPIEERVDFRALENYIRNELRQNGIELPFFYEVVDKNNKPIYRQPQFEMANPNSVYSQELFPNDPPGRGGAFLKVHFPSKDVYIYQELSFLVPAVMFTFILLVTFIIIITITFRQKKLSEMKNDFMNNMTHELKTPVSTISLAAQMLKDGAIMKSPEVFKHISGVINDETERLSFQVEKVLQMSLFEKQKATLKFKELEMNDIVASVANTFQIKVEKFGGVIDIDLQATEADINADKMHITNVLFNLLDNAVKYRREDVPLELMIRTRNVGNKLQVSVEDNGLGIKKEDVKKVFERFYRVSTGNRHDVKGFGLGLAYVKKIVEDHGGSIKAESELNEGTKFIITLPLLKSK